MLAYDYPILGLFWTMLIVFLWVAWIILVFRVIMDIFRSLGFEPAWGPEVELESNNFEKLAFPPDHPATDMQDTFWLEGGHVLRTHTSNGQVRAMHAFEPPFRAIFPGKVFRYEATDASATRTSTARHDAPWLLRSSSTSHAMPAPRP